MIKVLLLWHEEFMKIKEVFKLLVWQVSTYFLLVWIPENLTQFLQSQSTFKQIEGIFIRVLFDKNKDYFAVI